MDLAIHDDGTAHNPHVHLMLTTRLITPDGFGGKLRAADGKLFVLDARAAWAQIANDFSSGLPERKPLHLKPAPPNAGTKHLAS